MKAIYCEIPGQFIYKEIEMPVAKSGETLIKIEQFGICGTDLHAFEGTQPFFEYPRRLGHELAATVVDCKSGAMAKGDKVTVIPYLTCGKCKTCLQGKTNCCTTLMCLGVHTDGGMCEYLSLPDHNLLKNNNLSLDELALVEPLCIGAHAVRHAQTCANETVLVSGAGPIGLATIAFAQLMGAKVIVLETNEFRLDFCKKHGYGSYFINPKAEDALAKVTEITNGNMPDIVFDATGNLHAINAAFAFMSHGGKYVLVGLQKAEISVSHPALHKREGCLMSSRNATKADFEYVIKSIATKKIQPSHFITHSCNFDDMAEQFASWLNPANQVIKAIVSF